MNNFNNWGYNPMNYGYNQPKMPNPTNPLSKEDMALLKQKAPQFSLAVSQIDSLKAICTHRDHEGEKLIPNPDGSVTCGICGTTFNPINNADANTVEQIFKTAIDALETIKIMYMDIPDDVTKTYFQMTPFLAKAPQLFKIALDHFQRYSGPSVMANNNNYGGNAFAMFSALMNPAAAMGMGMPQQQVPYGQPGMAQGTPVPDVTMGMANGVNPFDVASPTMAGASQQVTDNKQYNL